MTEYTIDEIKKQVRIVLDQNKVSEQILNAGDIETLSLDEIIENQIPIAARTVETIAPLYLVGTGKQFGDNIHWNSSKGVGDGFIRLPEDFMRLIVFQMTDWAKAVTTAITPEDPSYSMQKSKFIGLRGNPQRPVAAIVNMPTGQMLEFYSCAGGPDVGIAQSRYLPFPKIIDKKIELCEKLLPAIIYYAAYLISLITANSTAAEALLQTSKTLMQ